MLGLTAKSLLPCETFLLYRKNVESRRNWVLIVLRGTSSLCTKGLLYVHRPRSEVYVSARKSAGPMPSPWSIPWRWHRFELLSASLFFNHPGRVFPETLCGVIRLDVAGPGDVFVALASVADAAALQASGDIALPFDASVPASVAAAEDDISGRPRFFAFPSVGHYAKSSNFCAVGRKESVHSSSGNHANHGPYNIFSSRDPHQNRNVARRYNIPSPGHNNASDTNDLPTGATTSRPRKTGLC
jgi:hypothetical protein